MQDQFGTGVSVPDITKRETRMWFYYAATLFIDAGFEAIHLGQLDWISENDTDTALTASLIRKIRSYADTNARRSWVFFDAHTHGLKCGDELLLDFHAAPLRLFLTADSPVGVDIAPAWPSDPSCPQSIYGRSLGGINPGEWRTDANPFLAEFDHGYSYG